MSPKQIERFFRTLSRELSQPATVILTGAAAGSLFGHVRASLDIDFAIRPSRPSEALWKQIEAAIARTERLTGIRAQYAEDIDRWSSVSLLDYRRHTRPYRTFGSLRVRLLDPAYWSIGKLGRSLGLDREDLAAVLSRQRVPVSRLVRVWARAIRQSPRSAALTQFRDQVEGFLRRDGKRVWGRRFDPAKSIAMFRQQLAPR